MEGVFLDEQEAPFVAAQWRQACRRTRVTETFGGKRLAALLLNLRKASNPALRKQVVDLDAKAQRLEIEIAKREEEMNALVYRLYGLSEEEIALVESERSA